jgi:hypothetical protein
MSLRSVPVRFITTLLIVTVVLTAVLAYPVTAWMSDHQQQAVYASAIMALANVILGYFTLAYGIDKSTSLFMISVFGGMGVRMMLILAALAILLVNGFEPLTLSLSFMGFYVVCMIVEIRLVLTEMGSRKKKETAAKAALKKSLLRSHSFFFELERN